MRRVKEEIKNETRLAQGERTINGVKYLISCCRTQSKVGPLSKLQVTISAYSMTSKAPTPKPLSLALTELCEKLEIRPEELKREANRLLNRMDVQSGALALSIEARNKELLFSLTKRFNTGLEYECRFFEVYDNHAVKILIEAHSNTSRKTKALVLTYAEAAYTLEVPLAAVQSHLEDLAALLIIEDAAALQLAKVKTQGRDVFLITISHAPEADGTHELPRYGVIATEAAVRIQRLFRAKTARDRVKLLNNKAQRQLVLRTVLRSEEGVLFSLSVLDSGLAYLVKAENLARSLTCSINKNEVKSVREVLALLRVKHNQLLKKPPGLQLTLKETLDSLSMHTRARKLLTMRSKRLDDKDCTLAIYQTDIGLVIECFKPEIKKWKMAVPTSTLMQLFARRRLVDEVCEGIGVTDDTLTLKTNTRLTFSNSVSREASALKIQAHLRGFVVRRSLKFALTRLKREGRLLWLKVVQLHEMRYAVSFRLVGEELRIHAARFKALLVASLSAEVLGRHIRFVADYILPTLKVIPFNGAYKLIFDPDIGLGLKSFRASPFSTESNKCTSVGSPTNSMKPVKALHKMRQSAVPFRMDSHRSTSEADSDHRRFEVPRRTDRLPHASIDDTVPWSESSYLSPQLSNSSPYNPSMRRSRPYLAKRNSSADKLMSEPAFIRRSILNRRPCSTKSARFSEKDYDKQADFREQSSSSMSAKSLRTHELLIRTGHKINSVGFVVSLFREEGCIKVEAVSEGSTLSLDVVGSFPCSLYELESVCSDILSRLTLVRRHGEVRLNLAEEANILYKKSHYISKRYFVVSVRETSRGVLISAYEPDTAKTLECNLGRRLIADSHDVQEELEGVMQRLKVQRVLGDDVLIVVP